MAERVRDLKVMEASAEALKYTTWGSKDAKISGMKILSYGTSGTGKTYFACSFPDPIVLDMEGGIGDLGKYRPLRIPEDKSKVIASVEELIQAGASIKAALESGKAPFKTVVVDSLNEMQQLVMNSILESYDANRQYDDQPTQADYGKFARDMLRIFRSFLRLPCNVVFTNTIGQRRFEDDQQSPLFMGKVVGPEICRLVSAIGYHYTSYETKGDEGSLKFRVSFANTPDHIGKDRLSIGTKSKPNNYTSVFKENTNASNDKSEDQP